MSVFSDAKENKVALLLLVSVVVQPNILQPHSFLQALSLTSYSPLSMAPLIWNSICRSDTSLWQKQNGENQY